MDIQLCKDPLLISFDIGHFLRWTWLWISLVHQVENLFFFCSDNFLTIRNWCGRKLQLITLYFRIMSLAKSASPTGAEFPAVKTRRKLTRWRESDIPSTSLAKMTENISPQVTRNYMESTGACIFPWLFALERQSFWNRDPFSHSSNFPEEKQLNNVPASQRNFCGFLSRLLVRR